MKTDPVGTPPRGPRRPLDAPHKSTNKRIVAHADAAATVLTRFRVVVRAVQNHYRGVEARCGLTGVQLWALSTVETTAGITVNELARELVIHQSTASNLLDRLERMGLIERRRTEEDRRVVRIFVTATGHSVLRRAPKPLRGVLQEALLSLSTRRLLELRKQLDLLTRHMHVRSEGKSTPLSDLIQRIR